MQFQLFKIKVKREMFVETLLIKTTGKIGLQYAPKR